MRKKLTAVEAKSINTPGAYRAGETLYLNVAPGGSKSWVRRLTVHGRRCDIGLGGFPLVSLAEARDRSDRDLAVFSNTHDLTFLVFEHIFHPVQSRTDSRSALNSV